MTRTKLETMTAEALRRLANQYGIDLPRKPDRETLVETIFEAFEEMRLERDSGNNNAIRIEEKKYGLPYDEAEESELEQEESDELPAVYNETRIMIMLRDPAWAFAYWDLKEIHEKKYRRNPEFHGMLIRVYELSEPSDDRDAIVDSFDIPVQLSDSRWYINLPEQDTHYRLELIARFAEGEEVLAQSNIVSVPKGYFADDNSASFQEDAIIALSGIEHLGVSPFGNRIPQRILVHLDQQYMA
ncbi:DUF4912 domain-containing protein [Salinispira pacifica]